MGSFILFAEKDKLEDKIYAVYTSPLKALSNDIHKNLVEPLEEIKELAKKMEFYTGAEIEGVAREAALICLKENKMKAAKIKNSHLEAAMKKVAPAVSKDMSDAYEGFSKQYASFKPSYVR